MGMANPFEVEAQAVTSGGRVSDPGPPRRRESDCKGESASALTTSMLVGCEVA